MRVSILAMAVALALPGVAQAETILGLTSENSIVSFDSASPTTITSNLAITGLAAGTVLSGIDVRPANGLIYSVSNSGTVYSLLNTGTAYQANVVSTLSTAPSGTSFGIDFNPTVDRLRLISNSGQNLRINVDTGATTVDGQINSASGGFAPVITGSAYTNNFPGATSTTLYGIDSSAGSLVSAVVPNAGSYNPGGSLGIALDDLATVGFDISGQTGVAYLSSGLNNFYTVNLTTGAATLVGNVGPLGQLRGLAVAGPGVPEPATWATMLLGFGAVSFALRRRRTAALA